MIIVENEIELNNLFELTSKHTSYWFPMWSDTKRHYMNDVVSFVFIRCNDTDFIYPLNHVDCINGTMSGLNHIWNNSKDKWVWNKKAWLSIFDTDCNDINSYCFINDISIDIESKFEKEYSFMYRLSYKRNINNYISILKLGGIIQDILNEIDFNLEYDTKTYNWFNQKSIPVLAKIEQQGIHVNENIFNNLWINNDDDVVNGKVYTRYNPFNTTGRPSNSHNGINYAALSKSDGSRNAFISNGIFLQLDYDAYHPRIISKLIKFELPKTPAHKWFADLYGCSVDEAKSITFRLLYGGIDDDFSQLPYFGDVKRYIDEFYELTVSRGYIQTPNRKIPLDWIKSENPQKVFNYLLQAIETELNIDKMSKVLSMIENTDIKMILYTYDSFLFDVPADVNVENIKRIKELLEHGGFPVKAKWGYKYSDL